jgi:hypothetical protein
LIEQNFSPRQRERRRHPRRLKQMSHAYVIQIGGRTAGIVARDPNDQAFHFFASNQAFRSLEGVAFLRPEMAERAARRIQRHGAVFAPMALEPESNSWAPLIGRR